MDLLKAPAVIGRLAGLLAEKTPPQILIDCQGVGYEVWVPMSSFYQLPALGERVTLLTHFVVREDAQLLYGFVTETERAAFRELIRISGIGPRMALAVLSGMSVAELAQAIAAQQAGRLTKVPGSAPTWVRPAPPPPPATARPTSCRRCWRWATATRKPPPPCRRCRPTWA